jgi:hypothetical protein
MLTISELQHDEKFVPHRDCFSDCPDSERWQVDCTVLEIAREFGLSQSLFNQQRWSGHTGWEFWTSDQTLILEFCLAVAEALSLELELE